jgi:hypothetical protein
MTANGRAKRMKKATYEQLVKVAVEYANNNNCSYAHAQQSCTKSQKEMCLRFKVLSGE